MPSGKLGNGTLVANTDKTIYTTPANTITTATISMCNRGPGDAVVRIAIAVADAPTTAEYIEYDTPLPANGTLERTGVVCSAGERIVVRSDSANVTPRAHGFEEAA